MSRSAQSGGSFKEDLKSEFAKSKFLLYNGNKAWMQRCQWSRSALPIVIYRVIIALITVPVCILLLVSGGSPTGMTSILYFTVWSYIVLTCYFVLSAIISVYSMVIERCRDDSNSLEIGTQPAVLSVNVHSSSGSLTSGKEDSGVVMSPLPWYMRVQWVVYNVALPSSILVTLIYWTVLYPMMSENGPSLLDANVHALNAVFMVIESWLNAIPTRIAHVIHPMVYGISYLIFSVIVWYAMNHFILYPYVLDWSHPGLTAVSIVGILVYMVVFQFVMFIVSRMKSRCNCC